MNLIHIGLPKTGSTSLQQQWSQCQDVTLVSEQLKALVDTARQVIRDGSDPNQLPKLWPLTVDSDALSIYSSEGLSGLSWGNPSTQQQYDYAHYLFANLSKERVPDAKVLLFVRSPEAWLRSVYLQLIHEGANFSFSRFVQLKRDYIASALNLTNMLRYWDEAFGQENIVVYPVERLFEAPTKANVELSSALNIPADLNLFCLEQHANASLNDDSAQLLRALSILNRRVKGKNSNLSSAFEQLNSDIRLLYRVQLQSHPKHFAFMSSLLKPIKFSLPKTEKSAVSALFEDGFLNEILRRGDPYNTVPAYQRRISKYLDADDGQVLPFANLTPPVSDKRGVYALTEQSN